MREFAETIGGALFVAGGLALLAAIVLVCIAWKPYQERLSEVSGMECVCKQQK